MPDKIENCIIAGIKLLGDDDKYRLLQEIKCIEYSDKTNDEESGDESSDEEFDETNIKSVESYIKFIKSCDVYTRRAVLDELEATIIGDPIFDFLEHLKTLEFKKTREIYELIESMITSDHNPVGYPTNNFENPEAFLKTLHEVQINFLFDEISDEILPNMCQNCGICDEGMCCGYCQECSFDLGYRLDVVCILCGDQSDGWEFMGVDHIDSQCCRLIETGKRDALNHENKYPEINKCYNFGYNIFTKLMEMKSLAESKDLEGIEKILDDLLK